MGGQTVAGGWFGPGHRKGGVVDVECDVVAKCIAVENTHRDAGVFGFHGYAGIDQCPLARSECEIESRSHAHDAHQTGLLDRLWRSAAIGREDGISHHEWGGYVGVGAIVLSREAAFAEDLSGCVKANEIVTCNHCLPDSAIGLALR